MPNMRNTYSAAGVSSGSIPMFLHRNCGATRARPPLINRIHPRRTRAAACECFIRMTPPFELNLPACGFYTFRADCLALCDLEFWGMATLLITTYREACAASGGLYYRAGPDLAAGHWLAQKCCLGR